MGRPVNKKFFGNTNKLSSGLAAGVGGEGFANVVKLTGGTLYASTATWLASAPQLPNGTRARGTITVNGSGVIQSFVISESGAGYTSTSTVSVTVSPATTGSSATYSIQLTSGRQNALDFLAWVPTASNGTANSAGSAVTGDIVKQQGTKRYYVKTAQGYGVCSLIATTPAIGQMTLIATDANGNTYYVTRLESKKARLTRKTQSGSNAWVYATNDLAKWTLTAANGTNKALVTTTVQIANA